MEEKLSKRLPKDLDEAIEMLKAFYDANVLETAVNSSMSEKDFVASCHSSAGMFIRNSWQLWWNKEAGIKQWNKSNQS